LQKDIQVKAGHYYSPLAVSNSTDRMTSTTTRDGLNFIKITPELTRDERTQTVSVNFVITRAPKVFVERIDIEGNSTTQDRVIRQEFRTAEGDPYNPREVQAAIDRLKATGYFKTVDVNTKPGDNPDQVIIDVNVTEQPTGSLSLGGSYAVDSGFGILLSFSEKNFLGRGQQLGLDINTSADDANSSIHFVEPHLYGRDLALSLDANFNRTTHNYANFDSHKLTFSPGINFPIGRLSRLGLHYKIQNGKISNIDSDASPIVKADSGNKFASMVGYDYTFNSNADGLSPDTYYELSFGQDFAGLGGNDKFIDTEGSIAATTKIMRQSVTLRAELDGGALTAWGGQNTYILDRFFLNGKMIGFKTNGIGPRDTSAGGNDALGGNFYAVAKVEARFPLGLPEQYGIEGGLFANVGSVWGLDNATGATSEVDDSLHLRGAAGFSIFWTTPIGPLRFNFSKAFLKKDYDKTQPFDFTISTQF
ncbi:outer membrane protein assembly factor BamA, partial [Thioclava sp. BHET1]